MARFAALIVDPHPTRRSSLKQLLHNEQRFGAFVYREVFYVSTPIEAIAQMAGGVHFDLVFIADQLPPEEIHRFIKAAREFEVKQGVAYVVTQQTHHGQALVSEGLVYGADGFLILPSSVSDLREITELANKIKSQAQELLFLKAIQLLIETVLDEIDLRAERLTTTRFYNGYSKELRNSVRRLSKNPLVLTVYLRLLDQALCRRRAQQNIYHGASKRVKRRFEDAESF